jgi:hypothetical protein
LYGLQEWAKPTFWQRAQIGLCLSHLRDLLLQLLHA